MTLAIHSSIKVENMPPNLSLDTAPKSSQNVRVSANCVFLLYHMGSMTDKDKDTHQIVFLKINN